MASTSPSDVECVSADMRKRRDSSDPLGKRDGGLYDDDEDVNYWAASVLR